MLGTRVSTYGGLLTIIVMTATYLVYLMIYKKKVSKMIISLVLISIGWILILPISPNNSRMQQIDNVNKPYEEDKDIEETVPSDDQIENIPKDDETIINTEKNDKLTYIEENINKGTVGEQFYKDFYPYEYDTEFWLNIVEIQKTDPLNYRILEMMIIKRVINIDDRSSNRWFGISNVRIQNIVNIERDFVLQYYAFGIIGMMITLLFYVYTFVRLLYTNRKMNDFLQISILACFTLFICSSFASGNSLNFLATTVPLAFIVSFSFKYKDC